MIVHTEVEAVWGRATALGAPRIPTVNIERAKESLLVESEFPNIESAAIRQINHPIKAIDGHFLVSKIVPRYRTVQLDAVGLEVPSESRAVKVYDGLATLADARQFWSALPERNGSVVAEMQGAGVSTSLLTAWYEAKGEDALKRPPVRVVKERRNAVRINLGVPHVCKSKVQPIGVT